MQVNDEIDAFRTLGVSAIDFLVLPRILALMLMVPLLTLYASFVGMSAGLLVSYFIFDIGFFEYYTETLRALEIKHFMVGLAKGSVYGAMVAYAGCLRGMHCGSSAGAVGAGRGEVTACSWADTRGNLAAMLDWCAQVGVRYA